MERSEEKDPQFTNNELASASPQSPTKFFRGKPWIWLVLLLLAISTAVVLLLIKGGGSAENSDEARIENGSATEHSPGSEVLLYLPGRSTVMVAIDEKSLDELVAALASRGDEVQALVDSGKVFTVPNNTRVRIVDVNFAKLKVRFVEGKRVMTEAWVPERWIR
jgi:hypothetical protein